MKTSEELYDQHAGRWARTEKLLLSDFTARPQVLEALGGLEGCHVLDLGCGEGYVARQAFARGAASVHGIDISAEMVERARSQAGPTDPLTFEVGDAAGSCPFPRAHYDRVMAVFLFNYLDCAAMTRVCANVRRLLEPGGRFVFTLPHPSLAFLRTPVAPFYFESAGATYMGGRDATFEGQIWRRDGVAVPVRCVHKTFTDIFTSLRMAGFTGMPEVTELAVTEAHLALDPEFFSPLAGDPLHVLISVERSASP